MNRIFKIINNSTFKKVIICFSLFLIMILGTLSINQTGKEIGAEKNTTINEITNKIQVNQNFICNVNNFSGVSLTVGTYARKNTSNLTLLLKNNKNEIIQKNVIECETLKDNSEFNFEFEKIKNSKGKVYNLEIVSDADEGNGITLYASSNAKYKYTAEINNQPSNLVLSINQKGTSMETIFNNKLSVKRFVSVLIFCLLIFSIINKFNMKDTDFEYLMIMLPALIILFFAMPPILSYDSADYFSYTNMLAGKVGLNEWNMNRSFGFPLILYCIVKTFGNSAQGLLTGLFILYFITIIFSIKIFQFYNVDLKNNKIIYAIFTVGIIVNPLILGIYHTVLTEVIGCTSIVISTYISIKWINEDRTKIKNLLYTLYFIVSAIFTWHVKEPYFATVLFPLFVVTCISVLKERSIKNIIYRVGTLAICCIMMLSSVVLWKSIMLKYNHARAGSNNLISNNIINNMSAYRRITTLNNYDLSQINNDNLIDDKTRNKILAITDKDTLNNSYIIGVYDINGQIVSKELFEKESGIPTNKESLKFLAKQFCRHPIRIVQGYVSNYLTIANILDIEVYKEGGATIKTGGSKVNLFGDGHQNKLIFYRNYQIRNAESNIFPIPDFLAVNVSQFKQESAPVGVRILLRIVSKIVSTMTFKIIILVLPIMFVNSFWKQIEYLRNKEKCSSALEKYNQLLLIASFSGVLIALAHCMIVIPIDRYAVSSYIIMIIAIIVMLDMKFVNKKI